MEATTIGDWLFEIDVERVDGDQPTLKRVSARESGLKESWFRDSIAANPELVIGPCRQAIPSSDESWYRWGTEVSVPDVGAIDVLLISESGRLGIVETKLSYNPEKRRNVVAQILDYAVNLGTLDLDTMPGLPTDAEGTPVAAIHDVERHLGEGDHLLIIAGDQLDPRAVRLSQGLLGDHQVNPWDLALVDLGLFTSATQGNQTGKLLVVPHLRGVLLSEVRHIVRVVVEGETPKARVEVERIPPPTSRRSWNETQFLSALKESQLGVDFKELVRTMVDLGNIRSDVSHSWGTGKYGSVTLKRNGYGLIELHLTGHVCFRPDKFKPALGEFAAGRYFTMLEELFPREMRMSYPNVIAKDAAKKQTALMKALDAALDAAE